MAVTGPSHPTEGLVGWRPVTMVANSLPATGKETAAVLNMTIAGTATGIAIATGAMIAAGAAAATSAESADSLRWAVGYARSILEYDVEALEESASLLSIFCHPEADMEGWGAGNTKAK